MGSLYDLLIDDPPEIRHAIGALVYDHLIAQKFNSSQSHTKGFFSFSYLLDIFMLLFIMYANTLLFAGNGNDSSEVHLGRMLQILREFSTDQILSTYVIDDVWEYMDAMKASSHIFFMYHNLRSWPQLLGG